jgi:hypothetical protein
MQITRNTTETAPGPGEWFTGSYIDTVATPTERPISGPQASTSPPARVPRGTPTPSSKPSTSPRE